MSKFNKLSRAEMKNVLGGVLKTHLTILVATDAAHIIQIGVSFNVVIPMVHKHKMQHHQLPNNLETIIIGAAKVANYIENYYLS